MNTTEPMTTTTEESNETIVEEPEEDPTVALVQSILIGALVGMAVGVLMMVVGYFVRRRLYRNTAARPSKADFETYMTYMKG